MISTKIYDHHRRKGAKCTECENLQECKLRDIILSSYINCCNYASEGCEHYKGAYKRVYLRGGNIGDYTQNRDINRYIRDKVMGEGFCMTECKNLKIPRKRVHNNLTLLKERGFEIIKTGKGDNLTYVGKYINNDDLIAESL